MLTDIGSGIYTKQYFSNQRYELLHTSSRGHSVPIVNGAYQRAGTEFKAKGAKYEDGVFSMDISGAYGLDELRSFKRNFSFDEDMLIITDEVSFAGDCTVTERFVATAEPIIENGCIILGDTVMTYDKVFGNPTVKKDINEKDGEEIYFIDFVLPRGTKLFKISVK